MPSIQEVANRNAQARRGVSVYSPTRRITRPQGGTANAGTAGRILQSRGQAPQWAQSTGNFAPSATSTLPDYTPPDQPGQRRTALDDILDSMSTGQPAQPEQEGPGGWRGVLGTVTNSAPGRAIFTALDALDRPRRAVAATLAEGLDALGLNAESRTDGDASWSDWWNQFNDPTFGFGDIVASTGNKWLDRGIGLAGDLAMDPLNYLSGSGLIAGTGARARVNLAARSFGAGIAPEVAARTGRLGLQALDNAERQAINAATTAGEHLLDRGYYWRLPFTSVGTEGQGWRIPFSGPVEQAIGGTAARARNAISSTRPMSTMRYWRSERGLQDAITKMLTGRGDISFGVAASLVNYRKGAGLAANRVNGLLSQEWNRMVQEYGHRRLQEMVHEAETVGGTALNRYYDFAADLLEKEGLQRPSFPNYIPHVFTNEAIEWLRGTPEGRAFHNNLFKEIDFDDLSPHMLQRKLIAGTEKEPKVYVLNGVRMEVKEGTIKEINEQFANALPDAGFKLLDDDIANLSARYSKSIMSTVGEAGGLLYLANQARGLVRYADDDDVLTEIVDAAKTRKLNVDTHKLIKEKLSAAKEIVTALKKERDEGITRLHGQAESHLQRLVETMDSVDPKARTKLKNLLKKQARLSTQRDALATAPLEYTKNADELIAAADSTFDELDARYREAAERLAHIEPAFRLAEQQWLDASRAARDARAAGTAGIIKTPPMTEVQRQYRKGVIELTQLTIDRDAAATIAQRVHEALRKQEIIERNLDSDTFLMQAARQAGEDVPEITPPVRYVDPDTGQVQWVDSGSGDYRYDLPLETDIELRRRTEGGVERAQMKKVVDPRQSTSRTPAEIYKAHNEQRAAALAPWAENFPTLTVYQNRIVAQTSVVVAAREKLFNEASLAARKIKEAQTGVNEWLAYERELVAKVDDAWGDPRKAGVLKRAQADLATARGPGGMKERTERHYADSQRQMADARRTYEDELRKLNDLKRRQDAEAMKIRLTAQDQLDEEIRGAGARWERAADQQRFAESKVQSIQARIAASQAREEELIQQADDLEGKLPQDIEVRKIRARKPGEGTMEPTTETRDAYKQLRIQARAQKVTTKQAMAELPAATADLEMATRLAETARAQIDELTTRRTNMESADYFSSRLREHDLRNRRVNAELHAQTRGRSDYQNTTAGRREVELRSQERTVNSEIAETDRQLDFWRSSEPDPWRQVTVVERPDGTLEVKPLWTSGPREDAVIELSEKRAWFTEHYIDKTTNELDVISADLRRAQDRAAHPEARNAANNRKLAKLIDQLTAKHDRLTTRLRRFRKFAFERYDRRIAVDEKVTRLVEARNAQVIERERIVSEQLALSNKLKVFDENITRLRQERASILADRAEVVKEMGVGVIPTHAQTVYGRHLRDIHKSERNALSLAEQQTYGYKLEWEPVAQIPTPEIGRTGVWTPEERQTLGIAYKIQQAWDALPNDLRTPEFKAQRDHAVRVIRELTNPEHIRGGSTYAQVHLRNIIEQYDDEGLTAALEQLQTDRIPFRKPTQRSQLGRALAKGSGAGKRTDEAIVRRSLKLYNDLVENYGEQFIERGIIPVGEMRYYHGKALELQKVLNAMSAPVSEGGGPSPTLLGKRDQLAADLHMFSEIMFTLRSAYEDGGMATPSNALSAFVASERLGKEIKTNKTKLQRVEVARGNKVVADADAALAYKKQVAERKMDQAEMEWELLRDDLAPEKLGRPMTEAEQRRLKNARARYTNRRKAYNDIEDSPMASVISEEVHHLAYIIEDYLSSMSAVFSDLKNARSITWNQGSVIRDARRADVVIDKMTGDIARFKDEIAEMRRLINEAQETGATTITYTPYYGSTHWAMTPQEVLDEIKGETRDKITQQREGEFRKKAQKMIAEGDHNTPIKWTRTVEGNEVAKTLSLYEATRLVQKHESTLVDNRWALEENIARRAALRGEAPRWITHYDQILQDQIRPPYIEVLRGELRDLEYELRGRMPRLNAAGEIVPDLGSEAAQLDRQLRADRIEIASNPPMTPEEVGAIQRKRDLYAKHEQSFRQQMEGETKYIAALSAADDGERLFTDIVTGGRPVTQDDIDIVTELFGNAEEAEMSIYWVNTFNQIIDVMKRRKERDLSELGAEEVRAVTEFDKAEIRLILSQVREIVGDSTLNEKFSDMLTESIYRTGFDETAEELQATAAQQQIAQIGEEAYTAGERLAVADQFGNEIATPAYSGNRTGLNVDAMRNQIIASLIESAKRAKDRAMADSQRMLRLLGIDNYIQSTRRVQGTTMTGAQSISHAAVGYDERLNALGYSISKQVFTDKDKLYDFLTDFLHGVDFDHSHALERKSMNLRARLARLETMQRALGASLDESANRVQDPDRFLELLAKWQDPTVDEIEDGAAVLDRATDFNLNVPPEMEQVYSDRISELQRDFAEAVDRNDLEMIARLGPQFRELLGDSGSEPTLAIAGATPTGTEEIAAEAATVAAARLPTNEQAIASRANVQAAERDLAEATQARAAAEAQLGGGGALSVPNPDAPVQARTLADFVLEDDYELPPPNKLAYADMMMRQRELTAQIATLESGTDEYRDVLREMSDLGSRRWKGEPPDQIEMAKEIYALEANGTPLSWDLPTGADVDQETLQRLQLREAEAKERLDAARSAADPAHLGPGDGTAGELAADLPSGASEAEARRAELQAQLDAARAAGDENKARWAEQQMSWIDDPDEAVQPAAVSPVERQGVPDTVTEPGELLPPPRGIPQELDQQFNDIVAEWRSLWEKYGAGYDNAPDEIKQRLAALTASAKKLEVDRRNVHATTISAKEQTVRQTPELAAYLERLKQIPNMVPPSISSDVWKVLRNGPSERTFDPLIDAKLKMKVRIPGFDQSMPTMGSAFPTGKSRISEMLRGNVRATPEGGREWVLGAQYEASLREQIALSPGRPVMTARERLITSLNQAKAEQLAAQREGVGRMLEAANANLPGMRNTTLGPLQGPVPPDLTPDEVADLARGELARVTPELGAAMDAEARAAENLAAATNQRIADAQEIARQEAEAAHTQKLAELDMQLAKVRTDVDAVSTTVANADAIKAQVKSALAAAGGDMKSKTPQVQDLLDLTAGLDLSKIDPAEANTLTALLNAALDAERKLDTADANYKVLDDLVKQFGKNPAKAVAAGEVMKKAVLDGWGGIATKTLRDEKSVVIAKDLRDRLERVTRMMETPEAWKLVDKYTAFFKTYATARPGFHVRNAMSAIFMNMVDGVRIRDMYAGLSAWHRFTRNPRKFWEAADGKTRDAITAVLASGAGGQFTERGSLLVKGARSPGQVGSRAYRFLMNNKLTRFNQRAGTLVEGAARMSMALNSAHRRQSLDAMVDRISKYHFNYRELSSMDVTARRYIPFWTFMSRNLPLQLEQMWLRPQMYLRYQSFVRNFSENPDPNTPEYWLMGGAFTMNEDAEKADAPWYLSPDLPHLRVHEPFEAAASGDWGKVLLSDVNPLMLAPTEAFVFNKKMYSGAPVEETYSEPSPFLKPLLPLLGMLGGTEQGASGQTVVDDRYAHVARATLPTLEQLERLFVPEGTRAGRQGETWARFFGAPVLKLTDEMRAQTRRSRRFEQRDERQTQAELARL